MSTAPSQPDARHTLNEVLVAELKCLRPDAIAGRPAPATFKDSDATRAENLQDVYAHIGDLTTRRPEAPDGYPPLSALCLSGGGIRSATFNLGVLQVLAKIGLLSKFDYLSSVSGGGYIASWLRAWMHRKGVRSAVEELAGRERNPEAASTEPAPVANLRDYTNYLTPQLGLFSGDTWSVVATVLRNLILNWLVLIPALGAVIGIPLLFLQFIRTEGLPTWVPPFLVAVALAIETIASVLVYWSRRLAKSPSLSQGYFVWRCVLPVCLAASALSAAGVELQLPWSHSGSGSATPALQGLWEFACLWSIVVPVTGWGLAELIARYVPSAKLRTAGNDTGTSTSQGQPAAPARQVSAGIELLALIVSGAIGAALFVGVVTWWFPFLYNHPALYVILVLPLLLGLYLVTRVIFVGITSLNDEHGDRSGRAATTDPNPAALHLRSRISSNDADREWWSRLSGWVLLVIVAWTTVTGICLIGCYLPTVIASLFEISKKHPNVVPFVIKAVVALVGAASGATAALTASTDQTPVSANPAAGATPPATKRLLTITAPLFLISLIMLISWGVKGLAEVSIGPPDLFTLKLDEPGAAQTVSLVSTAEFVALLAVLVIAALCASRMANVNRFSLHGMYRNRLVRAYLGASNCPIDGIDQRVPDPFTGFSLTDNFPLHNLCSPPYPAHSAPDAGALDRRIERPLSIINTTLNLVHGERLAWQQRKAESFAMTPLFCGNRTEGYRDSQQYGGPGGITVGTAVSISGAAANPSMGYTSSPVLSFLMAIFNVRLGAWLGNTNENGNATFTRPGPRHAIIPLFAEMFGLTNSRRRYVSLSDGGHFDNLGLYEVVLRRCRQVLVSDAGQDRSFSFEDLGNSIRKIRIDFGINIKFDRIQILPNVSEQEVGLCCAIGHICYSDVDGTPPEEDGVLIYIKPTLRGRGAQFPYDIYSYSKESVTFPHESTVDQWFSESQFESYRALGAHILTQLVGSIGGRTDTRFDDFHTSVSFYMTDKTPDDP